MATEHENPVYFDSFHLEQYDTQSIRRFDGELGLIIDLIDDILYPDAQTVVRPNSATAGNGVFTCRFSHEYARMDLRGWVWPVETVGISIEHTRYLGRSALKQCYKVLVFNQIHQAKVFPNKVKSLYYIEETAGDQVVYNGNILRPDLLPEGSVMDESMTAYDCDQLANTLFEMKSLAQIDSTEQLRLKGSKPV
jgi:hypothetical protein